MVEAPISFSYVFWTQSFWCCFHCSTGRRYLDPLCPSVTSETLTRASTIQTKVYWPALHPTRSVPSGNRTLVICMRSECTSHYTTRPTYRLKETPFPPCSLILSNTHLSITLQVDCSLFVYFAGMWYS